MPEPAANLEQRVTKTPCTRFTECTKKVLAETGKDAVTAYAVIVMAALCPPAMLYCAGACAAHGIRNGYHWLHDHLYAHHGAQT